MRSQTDILHRIRYIQGRDVFGFEAEVLIGFLEFENAKVWLGDEATKEVWEKGTYPATENNIKKEMIEYMEFAWDKALDHRGLSAERSIMKMAAWVWLLEDEETLAFLEGDDNYRNYGVPKLKKICEVHELKIPDDDWSAPRIAAMAVGKPCTDDCVEGCGR